MTVMLIGGEDQFFTTSDQVKICYRSFGKGTPLVLVAGLGLQLHYWSPVLINGLIEQGFQVVILDNRDIGRSDRIKGKPPNLIQKLVAKVPNNAYDLGNMANDVVELLDHLKIEQAHIVGMSMGGMISQTIAARYPARVLSLVSIFSTTGNKKVGQPVWSTMLKLAEPASKTQKAYVEHYIDFCDHIGSTNYDMHLETQTAYANLAWERGGGKQIAPGFGRQIGAILKSGDRTEEIKTIQAPTLVIHSDKDLIVDISGGQATLKAIDGAKMVIIAGMGHFLAHEISPYLVGLITGHAQRSAA